MNIQSIAGNNQTTFQSKIVPTKYLKDAIDAGIKRPRGSRAMVDGINLILNDGKNNVVKLDYTGNKLIDFLFKGAFRITINDTPKMWNFHNAGGGIKYQSMHALAQINDGVLSQENKILDGMVERLVKKQGEIFDQYDYGTLDRKKIAKLHKHQDYLQKKYDQMIKDELIKLRKMIFPEG